MTITLYADFNNADRQGRLRLNGAGTLGDLSRLGVRLKDGMTFTVHDEELAADGEAVYSAEENVWTARIDWSKTRAWTTTPIAFDEAIQELSGFEVPGTHS